MELIFMAVWFLVSVGFFLALIVTAYFVHVRGGEGWKILGKLMLSLVGYALLAGGSGFVMGLMLFIRAHSADSILGTREIIVGLVFVVLYITVAWLLCSFIVGHFIRPSSPEVCE